MESNWLAVLVAALVPTVLGFVWYHPKVMGTVWMKVADMTEEKMKGGNMALIFGLSFLFSFMLAMSMNALTIHQYNVQSLFVVNGQPPAEGTPEAAYIADFMSKYGTVHRTFSHGVVHGIIMMLFFGLPVFATNAMFERKSWKYVMVNVAYWTITVAIMGGIVCAWI